MTNISDENVKKILLALEDGRSNKKHQDIWLKGYAILLTAVFGLVSLQYNDIRGYIRENKGVIIKNKEEITENSKNIAVLESQLKSLHSVDFKIHQGN